MIGKIIYQSMMLVCLALSIASAILDHYDVAGYLLGVAILFKLEAAFYE